jgi:hypothetical protein
MSVVRGYQDPEKIAAKMRDVLEELDAELDRQLYDDEYVKGCRDSDLDIPADCEHHVVITEAMWDKIRDAIKT